MMVQPQNLTIEVVNKAQRAVEGTARRVEERFVCDGGPASQVPGT